MVQGVIERIAAVLYPDGTGTLGHPARIAVAVGTLTLGGLVGLLGIVEIIARGYTAMSYGFVIVYIIPVCTLGVARLVVQARGAAGSVTRDTVEPPD